MPKPYVTTASPNPSSAECVAAKHGIDLPRADICFSFEELSDDLGIANVKVTAYIMQLFDDPGSSIWNGLGSSRDVEWKDKCVAF
jgi:hypothetical protein